jgi:nitrite reductase/ring-hydroxylating ferredoxin subunit
VKIVVSRLDEFPPGERRIVEAGRRSIGVFRIGDSFYAINNYCPHQGGPLCLGRTTPWVRSTAPGEYVIAEREALLACPWHGWEYDLATGQSFLGPGEPPARTYEVSVEYGNAKQHRNATQYGDGEQHGDGKHATEAEHATEAKHGRRPGPYVAETFPVQVEDAYVVVDTNPRRVAAGSAGGER